MDGRFLTVNQSTERFFRPALYPRSTSVFLSSRSKLDNPGPMHPLWGREAWLYGRVPPVVGKRRCLPTWWMVTIRFKQRILSQLMQSNEQRRWYTVPFIQFIILIHHLFAIVIFLRSNITILPITIPNGVKDIRTVHQKVCRFLR